MHSSIQVSISRGPVKTDLPAQRGRTMTPGRWAVAAALLAVAAVAVNVAATSPALRWPVVWQFLFSPPVLAGVVTTLELTVASQALAIAAGVLVALLGRSVNPVAVWAARYYTWCFRAVPLLVQLLFWFNIALLVPVLRLPVPVIGFQVPVNNIITGFTAAVLGLGLHEGAYAAEIIRGGIVSVPASQADAAMVDGLTRGQAMRRVVLPQALPVIIPAAGNQFVGVLKASALVAAIGGGDLLTRVEELYGANYEVIPLLTVATIWYLVLVGVFSALQHLLETRLSRRVS